MSKEYIFDEGQTGWAATIVEGEYGATVFPGADAVCWVNEQQGRLVIETFVHVDDDSGNKAAHFACKPLGEALWQYANAFTSGDDEGAEAEASALLDPVQFERLNDASVLSAYRQTLERALAYVAKVEAGLK